MLIKQIKWIFMSAGFLPLSISIGCTHQSKPVTSERMYSTHLAGFSQAIQSGNLLFTSGTVAWDEQRSPLSEDFSTQLNAVLANLKKLAADGGSSLEQAVLLRFYVVDLNAAKRNQISARLQELFPGTYKPASSLLGVSALATEELLIEVEMISEITKARPL
jgi:2-iminobutanoate/2-iminopropanoate deaminase